MNMKRFNLRTILLALTLTALSLGTWQYLSKHTNEANLQRQLQSKQIELTNKLLELEKNKKSNKDYQKQVDKLKKDLQTKRAEQRKIAARTSAVVYAESAPVQQSTFDCGSPKMCIYSHESGNRTTAVNSIGCRGLGQACPGSKLPCGNDYACQDAWFTQYAINRYGGWSQAWAWWQNHHWW